MGSGKPRVSSLSGQPHSKQKSGHIVKLGASGFCWLDPIEPTASYVYAARRLLESPRVKENLVEYALPILYLQRHSLELLLKQLHMFAWELNERLVALGESRGSFENHKKNHHLPTLLSKLNEALSTVGHAFCCADHAKLQQLTERFDGLDERSTWLRFYDDPEKNEEVPVLELQQGLTEVFEFCWEDDNSIAQTLYLHSTYCDQVLYARERKAGG